MRFISYRLFFIILISSVIIILENESANAQIHHKKNISTDSKAELPDGFNELFAGSGECTLCHNSMTNAQGELVSIVADWRSSMMANAAKDPFWRAKLSHETHVNPQHAEVLEDVCTKCHATVGNVNAHHMGQSLYSIAEMENDPLALDGVSCTVCHQIKEESLGNYSGNFQIGEDKIIWGPYENPFGNPMINFTGYTPNHGTHIRDSKLCASCHTLLTNSVDLNGIPTGTEFVEQAVYHEWKNSSFPASGVSCQTCHVPEITDIVKISTMPPWLEGRTPFGQHHLAGANVFMLTMLKENMEELGVTASEVQMDSTINRARRMLQQKTLTVQANEVLRTNDTLFIDVVLENIAGHKFPTAYPSRRAFVEFIVVSETNDTVFHSGKMDANSNIINEEESFEPHYDVIKDESQVQIYELVMGNVNYEPTTILERAFIQLKDNRIPPNGFTSSHISYDTVKVVGEALIDEDFNIVNGVEGTGLDIIHYHVPVSGSESSLTVNVIIHYQTVTNKWLANMFTYSSDEIETFKEYYNNSDKEPVVVMETSLISTVTSSGYRFDKNFRIYPNPSSGFVYVENDEPISEVNFYEIDGSLASKVYTTNAFPQSPLKIATPENNGVYLVVMKTKAGEVFSDKILVN